MDTRLGNYSALKELLAAHEDGTAFWLYSRALVAFRESSDKQAAALVKDAWSANQHVPAILAGTKPAVKSNNGYITLWVVRTRRPTTSRNAAQRGIARPGRSRG